MAAASPALQPKSQFVAGALIEGVQLRRLVPHRDERGLFMEVFQEEWRSGIRPVQWSIVESSPNVFRGLHFHRRHDEYFALLKGRASVGLRDVRPWSRTNGAWSLYEFTAEDPTCLVFPPGLLHGWFFPEESLHLQGVSESHADYADDDNLGVHWADPALEIPWPCTDPVLSERAAAFGSLDALTAKLANWCSPDV